jgi:hypothetical protein
MLYGSVPDIYPPCPPPQTHRRGVSTNRRYEDLILEKELMLCLKEL